MIKYYDEIESNFFLPVNVERNINHKLDNLKLPKWFYERYRNLIDSIPKIKELFTKFSLDKYYNNQNYNQYNKDYLEYLVRIHKTKYLNISSNLNKDLALLEIKNSIQCWGNILELMFIIDDTLFERSQFISIMQLCNSALIDIGNIDGSLAKNYLSDKWLLTSKGYLYNMQSTAHEAGSYNNYYLEKMKWFLTRTDSYICKTDLTTSKINPFPEFNDTSIILKCGYIKWNILDVLLHSIDYYHFNYRIYDPKTIMISIGMIELQQDLFEFFKKLELYTDSPKDNLKKVIKITNDNYLDVLVRCCGVSKITSSPHKNIITSLLTAKTDFREYLERGYNVCFIPPIIINKETRMVEELNMDSPIVNAYIKNEVICENHLDKGKVYTNYLNF